MNEKYEQHGIYVRVAVFAPLWQAFDYLWSNTLGEPEVGLRLTVPFGQGKRVAIVLEVLTDVVNQDKIKPVEDRLDVIPILSGLRLRWLKRAAAYNLNTLGEMIELALAWASNDKQRRFRCMNFESLYAFDTDLALAFPTKRAISLSTIYKHCQKKEIQWRVLKALERGKLEEVINDQHYERSEKQSQLQLRPQQQLAVQGILEKQHTFFPSLLFGSTGSGKTEVYLQIAEQLAQQGKQTLILVPEIGLTPMWVKRLTTRFEHIGIWHSGLSVRDKIGVRHQLKDIQVLLGTRSALFLPMPKLGLIVLDEEHDTSFKQQDGATYSARDMAMLLGQELKIPVLLGSATPSLESWRQVKQQELVCYKLTERVYHHEHIQPEIIDMRGTSDVLSPQLIQRLKETHEQGKQSMLYLNRRGYAPALQCTACGDVPTCPSCSLKLTLHRKQGVLRCHTCDYHKRVVKICQNCGEKAYLPLGSGTERLEEDLSTVLPALNIARFDRDMIRSRSDLEATLSAFEAGDIDCLVGTQMLVKGHHFPNVTLVGVINADLGMNLPDFRASERWWQQMTQVFGRTGRGEQSGHVVVQTWSPDAPWFQRLDESKAEDVLDEELELRELVHFPPYARWVRIVFSAVNHEKAIKAAHDFAKRLQAWEEIRVSGPMPCAMERLAGRFRFELVLRDESRKHLPWKLRPLLERLRVPSGVRRKVDVDPQDLM